MFIGTERELLASSIEDPHSFFTCDPEWPICRFNFAKEHVIPEDFVFKIENLSEI